MRLLRFGPPGDVRPAGIDQDGVLRDLSSVVGDVDGALLGDPTSLALARRALEAYDLPRVPDDVQLAPPLARPGKIVGIGVNYRDYAAQVGAAIPERPVVFLKASSSPRHPGRRRVWPEHARRRRSRSGWGPCHLSADRAGA